MTDPNSLKVGDTVEVTMTNGAVVTGILECAPSIYPRYKWITAGVDRITIIEGVGYPAGIEKVKILKSAKEDWESWDHFTLGGVLFVRNHSHSATTWMNTYNGLRVNTQSMKAYIERNGAPVRVELVVPVDKKYTRGRYTSSEFREMAAEYLARAIALEDGK